MLKVYEDVDRCDKCVTLTCVLVEGVSSQFECVAAVKTLETAAMEEKTFCTQTLHQINSLLTEETDGTAA